MLVLDLVEDKDLVLVAEVLVLVEVRVVEDQVFVAEDQVRMVEHESSEVAVQERDEVAVHHEHFAASFGPLANAWHQVPLRWSSQRLVLPDELPQRWQEAGHCQAVIAGQFVVTRLAPVVPAQVFSDAQCHDQEMRAQTSVELSDNQPCLTIP